MRPAAHFERRLLFVATSDMLDDDMGMTKTDLFRELKRARVLLRREKVELWEPTFRTRFCAALKFHARCRSFPLQLMAFHENVTVKIGAESHMCETSHP